MSELLIEPHHCHEQNELEFYGLKLNEHPAYLFLKSLPKKTLLFFRSLPYLFDNDVHNVIGYNKILLQQIDISSKKIEQMEASLLRKEISSHFIYNTLNSIYTKLTKQTPELAEQIILLSEIMSYATQKTTYDEEVSLVDEIENIDNFLKLQTSRCSRHNNFIFQQTGESDENYILPLILLTFIENAFKHGDLTDKDNPVIIQIKISEETIFFTCKNKKYSRKQVHVKSSGIGLANTRKRLSIKYGNRYSLRINDTVESYQVTLTLNF
jgi:two-component system LytT family sensor kinase